MDWKSKRLPAVPAPAQGGRPALPRLPAAALLPRGATRPAPTVQAKLAGAATPPAPPRRPPPPPVFGASVPAPPQRAPAMRPPPAMPPMPAPSGRRPIQTMRALPAKAAAPPRPLAAARPAVAPVIQPKLILKGGSPEALAAAILKTDILHARSLPRLRRDIQELRASAEHHGEVDVGNAQQVELVAHRIVRRRLGPAKPRPRDLSLPEPVPVVPVVLAPADYQLLIVGAGSTAAYYLNTLGAGYDHSGTLVLGGDNPWRQARGHGIPYINHTRRQIAMPSENVTDYGGNESFVPRRDFALDASRVISQVKKAAGRWIYTQQVENISLAGGVYSVRYKLGSTPRIVTARKVVFAAGGGAQNKPAELNDRDKAIRNGARIIDMNTFIKSKLREWPRGRVVIWGSNAAIDAVAAAKRYHWTIVKWLYNADPAWLPGSRYKSKPYRLQEVQRNSSHRYTGRNDIKIEDCNSKLQVRDTVNNVVIAENIDYVVYGLGTDDLLTGASAIIDASVREGEAHLRPLLDMAGIFDPLEQRAAAESGNRNAGPMPPIDPSNRAFLGWHNPSDSFQVIGLAAENYMGATGRIKSQSDPRVAAMKNWLSGDVATVGQLTYIRSAVRAVNNYVPGSIVKRVDYSHADRNQLYIHIATKYPNLPESYAQAFIELLRTVRAGCSERLPHGFTQQQSDFLDRELAAKHAQLRRGTVDSAGAPQWCHYLKSRLLRLMPKAGAEVTRGLAKIKPSMR
jgi:hypothetical protein